MKTYVINLDRRPDRLLELKSPYPYQRISAVDGQTFRGRNKRLLGHAGCQLSHIDALEALDASGEEYGLILEDDVEFTEHIHLKISRAMMNLPEDFDLLYLGGWNKRQRRPYCEGLDWADEVWQTHAYIVRKKFIPILLDVLKKKIWKVDVVMSEALPLGKCFICNPILAWQRVSKSDVSNL